MRLKRAIWTGVFLWIAAFIVGLILSWALFGFEGVPDLANTSYLISGLVLLLILVWLAAKHYFKDKKAKRSAKEGLKLGITFLIVGFVLDIAMLLVVSKVEELLSYYTTSFFLIALILMVGVPAIVGAQKR